MKVRRAKPGDVEGIFETHTRAIQEICAVDYTTKQIDGWVHYLTPQSYLEPISGGRFFVAEIEGKIVGFSEYRKEGHELRAIYVHPDFTRRGVGRALFKRVCEEAAKEGFRELQFDASLTSVSFYDAMGCEKIEEKMHRMRSGIDVESVAMRMELI